VYLGMQEEPRLPQIALAGARQVQKSKRALSSPFVEESSEVGLG
jgi:hypothetical protein